VYGRLPHGDGFRNVRDSGAVGDGVADDTQAFIRALELGRGGKGDREKKAANVYVPSGTYLISDTLIVYRLTMLAGDVDNPPTIVLKEKSPGFGDPDKPRPMLVTYCAYDTDPLDRQWVLRNDQVGGSTNNTFFITIRNINLKIGAGNPGAWGIFWLVAQQTALRNMTIDAGDGQGCIKSFWWGGGGIISHLKLVGGDYGWHVQETSQWAARLCRLCSRASRTSRAEARSRTRAGPWCWREWRQRVCARS
jgi:glucan 1,3-beta-glucosidase